MAGGGAAIVGSLINAGASMYESRKAAKLADKQEDQAIASEKAAKKDADIAKKEQIKSGSKEAKRKNLSLRAYQTKEESLLPQGQTPYKLG